MNRPLLQHLSRCRQQEARVLLNAGLHAGAYYLLGYAVECALKACVAKRTRRFDFPDRAMANRCHTHHLETLVDSAGLGSVLRSDVRNDRLLENNWLIVKDWSVDRRYDAAITPGLARDLYSACISRRHGILPWVRRRW